MPARTPEQIKVGNIENRFTSNGYVLKVKTVPDPESGVDSVWTVEAKSTHEGHVFNSQPKRTWIHGLENVYRLALEDIEKQILAYYKARGRDIR